MSRCWIGLVAAALAAPAAFAQALYSDAPPPPQLDPPPKDGRVTIPMLLSPVAASVPAARYNVYPEYQDSLPGNKVQGLLRSFMEQQRFFSGEEELKRANWAETPLDLLPPDVRDQAGVHSGMAYPAKYTSFLANADKAARYTRTEWNEWLDLRRDGIYYLLPEVQKMRSLALAVRLRMRAEIKAGEWDRAVASAKTLFGIAQGLEQHPTLIGNLVGIAIATMAVNALEEMAARPDAPSLFWALTDLPAPVVGTRTGLSGERVFMTSTFAPVLEAKRPLADAELQPLLALAGEVVKDSYVEGSKERDQPVVADPKKWFARIGSDETRLAAARKRIVARGAPAAAVAAMPAAQIGLLDELYHFEEARDELMKWYNLPYWQAKDGLAAADAAIKAKKDEYALGPLLVASVEKVKRAETRLTARVGLLRIAEAVRLHAKATGGLPNTLDDVQLPLPLNPYNGRPFTYRVADGVATLGADGSPEEDRNNRWYEIRLRK